MANFSSFFPVAGGGGFTKMKKISTLKSADATDIKKPDVTLNVNSNYSSGVTQIQVFYMDSSLGGTIMQNADSFVGHTFVWNSTTHTITASTSHSNWGVPFYITFSPGLTTTINSSHTLSTVAESPTFNPSSDLGLSDGDSIGYMLVGAGYAVGHVDGGAPGGRIVQGTAIISNASTDLVITPGVANGGNSTISGGLTLTSGDGVRGWGGYDNSSRRSSAWSGIMGYGAGGNGGSGNSMTYYWQNGMPEENNNHGWGAGAWSINSAVETAYDGAVLIFY